MMCICIETLPVLVGGGGGGGGENPKSECGILNSQRVSNTVRRVPCIQGSIKSVFITSKYQWRRLCMFVICKCRRGPCGPGLRGIHCHSDCSAQVTPCTAEQEGRHSSALCKFWAEEPVSCNALQSGGCARQKCKFTSAPCNYEF